jgi:hypothetical protein
MKGTKIMIKIICEEFRPFKKNTLVGFADLALPDLGLRIKECPVHRQNDRRWVAFPARPWTDPQGKKQWASIIEFLNGADREGFQAAAVVAVRAKIAPPAECRAPANGSRRRRPYPGDNANV